MRVDAMCWRIHKRVCISIDDELFSAFQKFYKKTDDYILRMIRKDIQDGLIKNSHDAKLFIYSKMMTPAAFKCFDSVPG